MTVLQAAVLGLVQGVGEFLPISSSAHLILTPWFFGWPDPGLSFDVALHVGTLVAVVLYFWRDWVELIKKGLGAPASSEGRLFWYIVLASVPGAFAGLLLEKKAETTFRNPLLIGIMLMAMGLLLLYVDRRGRRRYDLDQVGWVESLGIGVSQALAIIPGVSRSGITMSAGLALGLTREATARFSFLLSTPIIAGAGLLQLRHLLGSPGALNAAFFTGVFVSALTGFLSIRFLLDYLRRHSFVLFVWYRLLLGALVIGLSLWRG